MRIIVLLAFCLITTFVSGQKIDNMSSFRQLQSDRYFRINYDNDYFGAQDKNYTQGYSFELLTPALLKNPINKVFFHLKEDVRRAGIAFEHIGFTPSRYEKIEIQFGDRPFSSTAVLKSFGISTNEETGQRLVSTFSFGVMGPAAKGREIQSGIHKLTNDRVPLGWINQIDNHFVIYYGLDYEKQLLRIKDNFALYANGSAKIGNLFTNASVGIHINFGLINSPYSSGVSKKFRLYAYIQPLVSAVVYDATLQGKLIGDKSIYTIPSDDVNRIVYQVKYGIVLQTKSLFLEYSRVNITKEIKTLTPAAWGGLKVGFKI